jgi:integrase
MAISKRYRKRLGWTYQVKLKGSDGKWITETFTTRGDAERRETEIRLRKLKGGFVTNLSRQLDVAQYFEEWFQETKTGNASEGYRRAQRQLFRAYVNPVIGKLKLQELTPAHLAKTLAYAASLGRGPSQRLHIYNLLHKMFGDAVELYEILPRNPAIRKLRPQVPFRESRYLEIDDLVKLLRFVEGKPYQTAIYLQTFAGLRVGEVQYLRWEHVDLKNGILHVRGTYLRNESRFQDHPKGKKWHRVKMPPELLEHLLAERPKARSEFVVVSPAQPFLGYEGYQKALKRYCEQAGVPVIPTHGLRHSSSELYMAAGASRDDLRLLFAHSCGSVTDRYVHDKGRRLDQVAGNVILFKPREKSSSTQPDHDGRVSPKFPQFEKSTKEG